MARTGDSRLCKVLPAGLSCEGFDKPGKTAPPFTWERQARMGLPTVNGLEDGRAPYCFFQRFSVGKYRVI